MELTKEQIKAFDEIVKEVEDNFRDAGLYIALVMKRMNANTEDIYATLMSFCAMGVSYARMPELFKADDKNLADELFKNILGGK